MKNIHVLPTDKPSRLFEDDLQLYYSKDKNRIGSIISNKHIYITNDEEIKEGDWIYDASEMSVVKCPQIISKPNYFTQFCKKIILTTDPQLIADGVQAIDDEFLEWFVNNPSCESVEVKCYSKFNDGDFTDYKIIIQKEEPKQETLEEVKPPIGKFIIDNAVSIQGTDGAYYHYSEVCKLLRLQQEQDKKMYSREHLINFYNFLKQNKNK